MGTVGVVLGVFLMFSAAVAWIGGDREKAFLEDSVKESQKAQTEMSREADIARDQVSKQDEHLKELQDKLEESQNEKHKLERVLELEERNKSTAGEDKSSNGLWDSRSTDGSEDGQDGGDDGGDGGDAGAGDARLKAAEESLRREAAARAEAEKKLVIEARALETLETELNETLNEAGMRWTGSPPPGGALCPWDSGGR